MSDFQATPEIEKAVRSALAGLALVWPSQFRVANERTAEGQTLVDWYTRAIVEDVRHVTPALIIEAATQWGMRSEDFGPRPRQLADMVRSLSRKAQENERAFISDQAATNPDFDSENAALQHKKAREIHNNFVFYGQCFTAAKKLAGDDRVVLRLIDNGKCPQTLWDRALAYAKEHYVEATGPLARVLDNNIFEKESGTYREWRTSAGVGSMVHR